MNEGIVLLVTRNGLGRTLPEDADFGVHMFGKLADSLVKLPVAPRAICFYTEGVKLLTRQSGALRELTRIAEKGVRLVACRTCVDYYELADELAVGEIGSMDDIVALLSSARQVITI